MPQLDLHLAAIVCSPSDELRLAEALLFPEASCLAVRPEQLRRMLARRVESRYKLRREDAEIGLDDLRGLLAAVRKAGEKGLSVTRFKGLGEMNAEELRETTLDPANRTLLQVKMEDVAAADELFRILMGDVVEPRRQFIEKHALEVRNLDV
jgi:DNA gyrase/topoisomerase IV subunit B